ncbi:MAG TPA: hypothetical protein VK752_05450 [Bryobacteraceae bacterium]|nr:hypothetical protein [Bryobacteraceae bacterium]
MALVNKVYWGIAAIEALFFVIAFFVTANQGGQDPNGGKSMALVFQIGAPFLVLCIVSFVYWKTDSSVLHVVLLIAVTLPVVLLAGQWIRGPLMDRDIAVGGYIFDERQMKSFVRAIAERNVQRVRELAPRIDVNSVGQNGATPLKFAIEKLETAGDSPDAKAQRLDMVRLLLSLGAKPDSALKDACASNNSEIIGVLLEGGVNPNAKDEEGTPAFFFCAGDAAAVEKLRLLAAKGADFNALDAKGEGALIRAATFSQWEKMLFFVDHEVRDTAKVNGKNAAARVAQAIEDDKQNSRETSPALQQLAAKLVP